MTGDAAFVEGGRERKPLRTCKRKGTKRTGGRVKSEEEQDVRDISPRRGVEESTPTFRFYRKKEGEKIKKESSSHHEEEGPKTRVGRLKDSQS